MQTITEALKSNATAETLGIEAWQAQSGDGLDGIIWDHGQERDSFTAAGFGEIESAVIAAGFDYREVERTLGSSSFLVADWTHQRSDDDTESKLLEITRR